MTLALGPLPRVTLMEIRSDAKVAELADAPDLGSGSREAMGVRLPPFANPHFKETHALIVSTRINP